MSRSLINRVSRHAFSALFVIGLASAAAVAKASPITVLNPSFELPMQVDGGTTTSITDWLHTSTAGVFNTQDAQIPNSTDSDVGGGVLPAPAAGNQVLFINSGSVYQDVDPLLANTLYTLTVAVGTRG